MNAQEMLAKMNRQQFSRDFSSQLLLDHLKVISDYLKEEVPLAVFCGFEDTSRGSGHSLAAVITEKRLVIGAHDIREDRVWEVYFQDVIDVTFREHGLELETEKGPMRIRVNDCNSERLVRMIRQLIPAEKTEREEE